MSRKYCKERFKWYIIDKNSADRLSKGSKLQIENQIQINVIRIVNSIFVYVRAFPLTCYLFSFKEGETLQITEYDDDRLFQFSWNDDCPRAQVPNHLSMGDLSGKS